MFMVTNSKDMTMALCGGLCLLMLVAIFSAERFPLGASILFASALQFFFSGLILSGLVPTSTARNYRRLCQLFLIGQLILVNAIVILGHRKLNPADLLLGLHPGTTLLVFGITLWPFVFVTLWTIGFGKIVFPEPHQEQIESMKSAERHSE